MRFLCNMGVSPKVTRWLRDGGHDAVHLAEEGLEQLDDDSIYSKARAERRIILTFDLHFARIAAESGTALPSVILFRLRGTQAAHVIERLASLLAQWDEEIERGAIVSVGDTESRVRRLPIRRDRGV